VEEIASMLEAAGIKAMAYHAGWTGQAAPAARTGFARGDGMVMVATIAFEHGHRLARCAPGRAPGTCRKTEGYYQEKTGLAAGWRAARRRLMVYGLQDVVNQRRMIDTSEVASEEFKARMRGAPRCALTLAEGTRSCSASRCCLGGTSEGSREPREVGA
jgi:ATP-dependent DNA helicase RecQ